MAGRTYTKRMIAKGVSRHTNDGMAATIADEAARVFRVEMRDPQSAKSFAVIVRAYHAAHALQIAYVEAEAIAGADTRYLCTDATIARVRASEPVEVHESSAQAASRHAYYWEYLS